MGHALLQGRTAIFQTSEPTGRMPINSVTYSLKYTMRWPPIRPLKKEAMAVW